MKTVKKNINGSDVEFYVARSTGGKTFGIMTAALIAIDRSNLEAADGTEGKDLVEKLQGYTLSNGQNAFETYKGMIVDVDEYAEIRKQSRIRFYAERRVGKPVVEEVEEPVVDEESSEPVTPEVKEPEPVVQDDAEPSKEEKKEENESADEQKD